MAEPELEVYGPPTELEYLRELRDNWFKERERLAAEIARLRLAIRRLADQDAMLTDEERDAIECGIQAIGLAPCDERMLSHADRLRGLLERTK